MGKLFQQAYELENFWTPVGKTEKLTKEELKTIRDVRIRRKSQDGYTIVNAVVFFNNGMKPKSLKISPYSDAFHYDNNTRIDPESIELQECVDTEGESKVFCECEEL